MKCGIAIVSILAAAMAAPVANTLDEKAQVAAVQERQPQPMAAQVESAQERGEGLEKRQMLVDPLMFAGSMAAYMRAQELAKQQAEQKNQKRQMLVDPLMFAGSMESYIGAQELAKQQAKQQS